MTTTKEDYKMKAMHSYLTKISISEEDKPYLIGIKLQQIFNMADKNSRIFKNNSEQFVSIRKQQLSEKRWHLLYSNLIVFPSFGTLVFKRVMKHQKIKLRTGIFYLSVFCFLEALTFNLIDYNFRDPANDLKYAQIYQQQKQDFSNPQSICKLILKAKQNQL